MNAGSREPRGGGEEPKSPHTFHIPVMGTAFSIDSPLRVARYGISSVVSLVDDVLIEQMRQHHCREAGEPYSPIESGEEDARARRITAYLDLLGLLVSRQVRDLRRSPFVPGSEITRYFELIPDTAAKEKYRQMLALPEGPGKEALQDELRALAVPGSIDVNIMTKVDRTVYRDGRPLPTEYCEAMAALRGFALSTLRSSVVLSAGLNPRLYGYAPSFEDFFPDPEGLLRKKIILKVSDYRSAEVQGKYLAKRGLWVSEFRIESGINCGGHTFPSTGLLIGPILEEFRENRSRLLEIQHRFYRKALQGMGRRAPGAPYETRVTVQGGIGEAGEDRLLRQYYGVDSTGWGTPFLLCPEATIIGEAHLGKMINLREGDVYLSNSSPLGFPFWNLRTSASEEARRRRIDEGRPGSTCPKGHLKFNTEFTKIPLCGASRAYQKLKLAHLPEEGLTEEQLPVVKEDVLAKSCICHDLAGAATLAFGIDPEATPAVCCGPNIVNFKKVASLEEMVGHIYGRLSILANPERPHMFVQELRLYIDYLRGEAERHALNLTRRQPRQLREFRENLLSGIEYYRGLAGQFLEQQKERFQRELSTLKGELEDLPLPAADS